MRRLAFIIILVLVFIVMGFSISAILTDFSFTHRKMNCSDFRRQEDAQDAYNEGAKQLDGNNNGIACENLPK